MKRIIVSLAAALAVAVVALPAGAGNSTPTGVRLPGLFFGGTQSIQANTAFYVSQKFVVDDPASGCDPCDTAPDVQQSSISLTVNGKAQNGSIILEFTDTKPRTLVSKTYLFNFPNGLPAGTYTFVLSFTIRGRDAGASPFTTTIVAQAPCQYGTVASGPGAGLLCAPQPPA